jgi:hypothetical protein
VADKTGNAGDNGEPSKGFRHELTRVGAGRRRGQMAAAAVLVACVVSIGGGVWAWNRLEQQSPLGAPPPPPPPPRFTAAPVLPSTNPPTLTPSARPTPTPAQNNALRPAATPTAAGSERGPVRPLPDSHRPAGALTAWSKKLHGIDIPPVALQAYGYAETVLAVTRPGCHLSWTVLAGIGAVESDHGRYHGAALHPDGTSVPPIIGVPLAGIGTERVGDTDGGKLDGDRSLDRAVGPMQFLPATWKVWAVDADGNGKADPFDIDDAALAAADHLCAGDADLSTGPGWSAAVFRYNHLPHYVDRIYDFADAYGRAA